MSALWYASVSTYRGISFGAVHFYVKLHCQSPRRMIEVQHVLTEAEAEILREKDDWPSWRSDDTTQRFDTKEEAIEAARIVWAAEAGEGDALILGDSAYAEPQPILEGPRDFKIVGNRLHELCEKIGWWDGPESGVLDGVGYNRDEAMNAICKHWDILLRHNGLHEHDYASRNLREVLVVERSDDGWALSEVEGC